MNKLIVIISLLMFSSSFLVAGTKDSFVSVDNGHFIHNGKPYYFVGTNFWYGAILGSEGQGGNRQRLCAELDSLKSIGIDNLRILVGSDGERGVKTKVEPTLQIAPGVYNDTIFAGLDYLLMEMGNLKVGTSQDAISGDGVEWLILFMTSGRLVIHILANHTQKTLPSCLGRLETSPVHLAMKANNLLPNGWQKRLHSYALSTKTISYRLVQKANGVVKETCNCMSRYVLTRISIT